MTRCLSRPAQQPLQDWRERFVRIAKATLLFCAELALPFGGGGYAEVQKLLCTTVKEVVQDGETGSISSMSVITSLFKRCHQEVSSVRSAHVLPAKEGTR
jgi:hypothetical protein